MAYNSRSEAEKAYRRERERLLAEFAMAALTGMDHARFDDLTNEYAATPPQIATRCFDIASAMMDDMDECIAARRKDGDDDLPGSGAA